MANCCLTPRPEENCDAISDTKRYTVRRFTIAAYGTMDNTRRWIGNDVVYAAPLVANPRNVFSLLAGLNS